MLTAGLVGRAKSPCRSQNPSPLLGYVMGLEFPADLAQPTTIHLSVVINADGFLNSGSFDSPTARVTQSRACAMTAWGTLPYESDAVHGLNAQIATIRRRLGERVKSSPSAHSCSVPYGSMRQKRASVLHRQDRRSGNSPAPLREKQTANCVRLKEPGANPLKPERPSLLDD